MTEEEFFQRCLEWRGINTPCAKCRGSGSIWYGSTATWHGGMGGASCTYDVCDSCWGSGDAENQWADLRQLKNTTEKHAKDIAEQQLATKMGLDLSVLRPALSALADDLDKMSRQRRPRPYGWDTVCTFLAKMLRGNK